MAVLEDSVRVSEGRENFSCMTFVLMPEHVHLLLTPATDVTIEHAIQLIKGGYSHAFGVEFRRGDVWQRGFRIIVFGMGRTFGTIAITSIRIP
jgi:putative transposase